LHLPVFEHFVCFVKKGADSFPLAVAGRYSDGVEPEAEGVFVLEPKVYGFAFFKRDVVDRFEY
jgi:hypothetical protein